MSEHVGNQNVGFLMTRLKYTWVIYSVSGMLHDVTIGALRLLLSISTGQLHSWRAFSLIDRPRDKININVQGDKNISATFNSKSRTFP